ncbi:MAG: DUF4190 domain-containing protein [Planctomycetota bacterium]|nr:DUF4190 domain-containing protein [Planctomycetota bacterium]
MELTSVSQFENESADDVQQPMPKRISALAIWSLVLGIIGLPFLFCACPLPSMAAVVLGVIAWFIIPRHPELKGRVLGFIGAALGLLSCLLFVGGIYWGATRVLIPFFEIPSTVMRAVQDRDVETFRDCFAPPAAMVDTDVIEQFMSAVNERYGSFQSATFDQNGVPAQPQKPGPKQNYPWIFKFTKGSVKARVLIQFERPDTYELEIRVLSIELIDQEHGNLVFPPAGDVKE